MDIIFTMILKNNIYLCYNICNDFKTIFKLFWINHIKIKKMIRYKRRLGLKDCARINKV